MSIEGLIIEDSGVGNIINISPGINFKRSKIVLKGNDNKIVINEAKSYQDFVINFNGNNKDVNIGTSNKNINGLKIVSIRGDNQKIFVGKNFSCGGLEIQMNDGYEVCTIGDDCLFSWGIKIRTSDGHSVIDLSNGNPINWPKNVYIGNRVWVGEDVRFLKGSTVSDDSVVGSSAVLTKPFDRKNCVIAGFPAKIVKENIQWDYKKPDDIKPDSKQKQNNKPNRFNLSSEIKDKFHEVFTVKYNDTFIDFPPIFLDSQLESSNSSFISKYKLVDIFSRRIENAKVIGGEFYCSSSEIDYSDKYLFYLTSKAAIEKKALTSKIIHGDDSFLYVSGANSGYKNFYHWIYQCLPSIILAQTIYSGQKFKIVLPPLEGFRKRSLELLGIKDINIHILEDDEILKCKSLVYSNLLSGQFSFNPVPFIEQILKPFKLNCQINSLVGAYPEKIYISRKDTNRRVLANDAEISEYLSGLGFQEIVMSDYSLEEQVSLFSNAKFIIAPHGAALVHLLFSDNCKNLIEICPSNYVNDCFFKICQLKGIGYSNVVANSDDVLDKHYHHARSYLDIEKLKNLLVE